MNQSLSSRAPRSYVALLAFVAIALGACSERPNPTQPTPPNPSRIIICDEGCGGGGGGGGSPPPPPPAITSLSLPNSTLAIEGASVTYNATLTNDGPSLSGAVAQGYIVQGSARRSAGGAQINCGAGTGVLPNGTCQISFGVVAGNNLQGSGTLSGGSATFELDLTVGSLTTSKTVGVTLLPASFSVSGSTTLSLSGALGSVEAIIQGGSQTVASLSYQVTVVQGSTRRPAASGPLTCGLAPLGNLPPSVVCRTTLLPSVTNNGVVGSGTLFPGAATFQVSLLQGTTVLNTKSWPMTLIDARLLSITPSPIPPRIGGGSQLFTAGIWNAGEALRNVSVSTFIRQGAARSASQSASVSCGYGPGYVPAGSCTFTGTYAADTTRWFPYIVPGPATLTFEIRGQDPSAVLIDVVDVPITLVSLPTIGTVTPNGSPNIAIFGTVAGYTAAVNNPGPAISNATVMVKIIQGSASREGIPGPVNIDCGSGAGTLAAGNCTFNGLYSASNIAPGTGTLVPGAATLQIQLSDPTNGTVSTKLVPITILGS